MKSHGHRKPPLPLVPLARVFPGRVPVRRLLAGMLFFLFALIVAAQDTISPLPPRLLYISVEPPTGDVSLYWQPSPDTDVAGYIIYHKNNAGWVAVDTLHDPAATAYRDVSAHANLFSEGYVIAAYDSALNLSPLTTPHTTNLLKASFDSCQTSVYLSWTGYQGWDDNLLAYIVYGRTAGGSYRLLDSLSPAARHDTVPQVLPDSIYCFIIKAWHRDGWVSLSNRRCVNTRMLPLPAFIACGDLEVTGSREVHLQFLLDTAAAIRNYVLIRGPKSTSFPDTLMRWTGVTGVELTYTDVQEDSIRQPLYYRLLALNACGGTHLSSKPFTVTTPHITSRNFINHISWPAALSYDTVTAYRIYRKTDTDPLTFLAEIAPDDTLYDDNIYDLQYRPGNHGNYCYRIETTGTAGPSGTHVHSLSPLRCITLEENVFFPNAFTPNGDGINDLFAPVFSFAPADYRLIIRDRWGTIVFESRDYLEKWDGRDLHGKPVEAGTYVYYFLAHTSGGKTLKKTGQVMVIYPK